MTAPQISKRFDSFPLFLESSVFIRSILAAMLLVAGLVALIGGSPLEALSAIVAGVAGSRQAAIETVIEAAPMALCGLAFLIPSKVGFVNIGAQGDLQVGALAAVFVTTSLSIFFGAI